MVSNFDSRLKEILRVCGLLSHFSFLITSEEAGIAKPSPAIFDQALQKCGVPAASVAHIGDHYVNDYLTSRSVGIRGFLLDRHNKQNRPDVPREHRLSSLEELPSQLRQHMDWCRTVMGSSVKATQPNCDLQIRKSFLWFSQNITGCHVKTVQCVITIHSYCKYAESNKYMFIVQTLPKKTASFTFIVCWQNQARKETTPIGIEVLHHLPLKGTLGSKLCH